MRLYEFRRLSDYSAILAFPVARRRGCVSLLGFSAFSLPSGLGQILGQGLGFHLNAFLVQLFNNLLSVETALLHPLQRRGECENGLLHGHGAVSVQCDSGGLESGNLLSDFLQSAGCDAHGIFSCD